MRKQLCLALTAGAAMALTACGSNASGSGDAPLKGASFVIGGKDFSEQSILAQLTAQLLKKNGANVSTKQITGSVNTRKALESGDISLYWEYTGTAWVTYLKNAQPIKSAQAQYDAVAKDDLAKNGVKWLPPGQFNNTYAFATPEAFAQKNNLSTMSSAAAFLKSNPGQGTFCVESEFASRDDGLDGMLKAYGIPKATANVKTLDTGVIYTETAKGVTCNFGEVFTTDGRIPNLKLKVMEDDKSFFPVYQGAPTLLKTTLDKYPMIADIVKPLEEKLTTEEIQKLNAQVDVDGLKPEKVAEKWLQEQKLL
jgi:osmoprotectant transport system substrate-binding protein